MGTALTLEELVDDARARTGLEAFDSDSWREGLAILVADINDTADLRGPEKIARFRNDLVTYLATRLKITDYLARHPELLDRPIEKPVFVMGVPRTGTTLMSNLLAADPARRSPLTWEIDDPTPPVSREELTSNPRVDAKIEAEKAMLAARPEMGRYYRGSVIYPNECVFMHAGDFKTLMLESRGRLPRYREYVLDADISKAYEYEKKFLQVLQHKAGGTWNLKMPSHVLFIDHLLKVFPDARMIWTHRDPFTAVGSLMSIITLGHRGMMLEPDFDWIGSYYPGQAAEHANRGIDARDRIGWDRVIDVQYADLMRDPMGVMKTVYAQLGDDLTLQAQAGIQGWLDDNPQGKFGKHEYKLAQYGTSKEKLEPLFERYLSRFDVEREG